MLRSYLCYYSDAYIVLKGRIAVAGENDAKTRIKNLIFKNNAPFRSCTSKINNTFIDSKEDLGIVMPMYYLLEYSNNYSMQGFNQPSQMLYNVIFPTETNFPIRSRDVFYFLFSLIFKAFVMLVTFLLFQSNLYIVLACGKGPKNSIHRDLFKTKNPQTPSCVLPTIGCVDRPST